MTDSFTIHSISSSDSEEADNDLDLLSRLKRKYSLLSPEPKKPNMEISLISPEPKKSKNEIPSKEVILDGGLSDMTVMQLLDDEEDWPLEDVIPAPHVFSDEKKETKKTKTKSTSNEGDKKTTRQQRSAKNQEKENEKLLKQQERAMKKAMKPGESLKYLEVQLDRRLIEIIEGSEIIRTFASSDIQYKVVDQRVPYDISFVRKHPITNEKTTEEEHLVFVGKEKFLNFVDSQIYNSKGETLIGQCEKWKEIIGPKLTLLVVGLNEHYKTQKTLVNRNFKQKIGAKSDSSSSNRRKTPEGTLNSVNRVDVENALVALEVELNLNHRLMSDSTKLAEYLVHFTKSVADKPFKQDKEDAMGKFNWYVQGSNNNTVKIDKSGVGLLKLWHQQLRQFNNVGVEVAQAIAKEYSSPQALVQAYENRGTKEASLLLAQIPVRRGQGVLVSTRKVGPELSKKIFRFFTSEDPNQVLSQE